MPDLLVAGGGPWGLAAAWRAAAEGARVTVVHDHRAPAGSVAAGMLGQWSEAEEGRDALNAALRTAADAWPAFAGRLATAARIDPGFARTGTLLLAARSEHVGEVRRRVSQITALGRGRDWMRGSALRAIEPGLAPGVAGGTEIADEHQVDPRQLLAALGAALENAGGEIVDGVVATARRDELVLTSGERLGGARVLVAAGWNAGALVATVPLRPVKGQVIRLVARTGEQMPIRHVVRTPAVYLVPRPSGELVIGATAEEVADQRVTAGAVHRLLDEAIHVVPDIRELELREVSAGLRPAAPDGLPVIGEDADGVLHATGGFRHGILLTPLVAEAVAGMVRDGESALAPFSPRRFGATRREAACASS